MSKECRRDDSFVTAIAHCHGDAGEANGDGSQRGREANGDGENGFFSVPTGYTEKSRHPCGCLLFDSFLMFFHWLAPTISLRLLYTYYWQSVFCLFSEC